MLKCSFFDRFSPSKTYINGRPKLLVRTHTGKTKIKVLYKCPNSDNQKDSPIVLTEMFLPPLFVLGNLSNLFDNFSILVLHDIAIYRQTLVKNFN